MSSMPQSENIAGQINDGSCPPECGQNWQSASDPIEHVDHCPSRTSGSIVEAAITALAPFHPVSRKDVAGQLQFWVRRSEMTDADLTEIQNRMFPRVEAGAADDTGFRFDPDARSTYQEGYADGYVDCLTAQSRMPARPARTPQENRDSLLETAMSALITVGMVDKESADALISLWYRRDQLSPVELEALQAAAKVGGR